MLYIFVFSGTRWIAHKVRALDMIMDKYGIYLQHVANLAEDRSYTSLERSKLKGWYTKWTRARIPLLVSISIEVLSPAKILSKTFQAEDIDKVATEALIEETKQKIKPYRAKSV